MVMRPLFAAILACACLCAGSCTSIPTATRRSLGEAAVAVPGSGVRVALVVGNGAYKSAPHLRNPPRDARAMGEQLRALGFETLLAIDVSKAELEQQLHEFVRKVDHADVALLFYAGHGLQVSGHNFFVPIDAHLQTEADVPYETVDVERAVAAMQSLARVGVLLLDSCRDNPLANAMAASSSGRGLGRGLVRMEAEGGEMLIVYATSPEKTAEDGSGEHSPFTTALLRHIGSRELEVQSMLKRVIRDVEAMTAGAQVPWQSSSLRSDVYLADPRRSEFVSTSPPAPAEARGAPAKPEDGQPGMVAIPGGTLQLDYSSDGQHTGVHQVEGEAVRSVTVKPFWIDRTEVTAGDYVRCINAGVCKFTGGITSSQTEEHRRCNIFNDQQNHPMNCVRWEEAGAYCKWAGKRLPSEEEWLFAAHGSDGRKYPWGSASLAPHAACWFRLHKGTCEVGSFPLDVSAFGVLDMFGNVREWTSTVSPCCNEKTPDHLRCAGDEKEYVNLGANYMVEVFEPAMRFHVSASGWLSFGFRCAKDR